MSSGDATLGGEVPRGLVPPAARFAPQARPAGAGLDPGSLGEVAEPAGVVLLEPIDCLGRRFEGGHAVLFGEPRALAQRPLAHVGDQPLTHREVDVDVYPAGGCCVALTAFGVTQAPPLEPQVPIPVAGNSDFAWRAEQPLGGARRERVRPRRGHESLRPQDTPCCALPTTRGHEIARRGACAALLRGWRARSRD